jgi:GNAT superfamily N-acetyltransferase
MIIETYTDKYHDDVVDIIDNFYKEAIRYYDVGLDKDRLMQTITMLKAHNAGNAFLLIIDGKCQGILAGIESPAMLNTKRIFQELIWYVNEPFRRYGVGLLHTVQTMLKIQGFDTIIMTVLEASKPEKIKKLYERMGFKHFETHYIRNL